jgi:Ferritin-like domain
VRQVLAHERAHLSALNRELASLGTQPPAAPADVAAADALLTAHNVGSRVSSVRSEEEGLQLLLDIERLLTGNYFDAISRLQSGALAQRSAEIMASEAQHAAVLAQLMTPGDFIKIAPTAFVQAKR